MTGHSPTPGRVVIAGSLAQRPYRGGHAWVFLQYLLGFRKLGWDVLFLDRLDEGMCHDSTGRPCPPEDSVELRYLANVMDSFGLGSSWAVTLPGRRDTAGMCRRDVETFVGSAATLLNVNGFFDDDEILDKAPQRVWLDIDPGFLQMWQALGLFDAFQGHDAFVTVGTNLGGPDCLVPTCGLPWITSLPPVDLDHWPTAPLDGSDFTSLCAWRGPFGPVEYQGRTFGLRVHEFRRFMELPTRSGASFRLALDIDESDAADRQALHSNGWSLQDPVAAASEPASYQSFIRGSAAEFLVAKDMYVRSRSGWVSDRSVCYLASGRPVLAQDTGVGSSLRNRDGFVLFSSLPEAVAGVERIQSDPVRHARAARAVAEELFDSDVVLTRLMNELSARSPRQEASLPDLCRDEAPAPLRPEQGVAT